MSQLTRSIKDRVFVGVLGGVFVTCFGVLLAERCENYSRQPNVEPHSDWVLDVLGFLITDAFLLVFIGSVFGIFWALFTPDWLERLLKKTFRRFLVLLFLFSLFVLGILFWVISH